MFFKDIVGQDQTIKQLIANVRANRISHARLFLGAEGSGHLPLALALSTYIHCTSKGEHDACGICPACLKIKKLEHPDLHFFFPVAVNQEHKKDPSSKLFYANWRQLLLHKPYFSFADFLETIGIENKQAIINAEDCNEIIRVLGLKSYESRYKIVIIYMAEKIYHAAAPKLLKILEEPPDNTFFLLVAENKDLIINTILSRTQIMKVPRPDDSSIQHFLTDRYPISEQEAIRITSMVAGNISDAVKMVERDADPFEHFEVFRSWMRLCYNGDVPNILKWIENVVKTGREKQKSFLVYGLRVYQLCLSNNYGATVLLNIHEQEMEFITRFSKFINHNNMMRIVEIFNEGIFHIERNANPRILMADISFQLARLLKA